MTRQQKITRRAPAGTTTGEFTDAARQAVYDVIALRRDIRNFRPDAVPDEVLLRLLGAAHRAGSVGYMQPWDFVLIRSAERREQVYRLFRRANERAAQRFSDDRRAKYGALKLQGILDAPLAVCVTCDTRRGGPHVLGRDTIRETDIYSTCLAVQNFWLAARAEGIGVGWVSIVDNDELAACLGLPEGVVPIAFLCVGYPVDFPDAPMLEATGWRDRLALSKLIHYEGWGGQATEQWTGVEEALTTEPDVLQPMRAAEVQEPVTLESLCRIPAVERGDEAAAWVAARWEALAVPRGSLGRLQQLGGQLARVQGRTLPSVESPRILVFAGDHGVCAQGVSAYRREVTARLCYNMVAGGSVINVLAREAGAELTVVDVGVDHDFGAATGLEHHKVARGTRDLSLGPAMTRQQAERALLAGARAVHDAGPCDVLALGEVGIGNTTAGAALLALLTGAEADDVVGRGTGVGDRTLQRKRAAVDAVLARVGGHAPDALSALAECGGLEIAALAGAVLAAAGRRVPVLLDGFLTAVAALAAVRLAPAAGGYLIASHCGTERGHRTALDALGLEPLLALQLRLGEGSGAALALPLLRSACAMLRDVRTFREAGIDEPLDARGVS